MSVFLEPTRSQQKNNQKAKLNKIKASLGKKNKTNQTAGKLKLKKSASKGNKQPTKLVTSINSTPFAHNYGKKRQISSKSVAKSRTSSGDAFSIIIITLFRLGIVGVGLGTILGTVLANIDLTKPLFPKLNLAFLQTSDQQEIEVQSPSDVNSPSSLSTKSLSLAQVSDSFQLNKKLTALETKLTALKTKYPNLEPGIFFVDTDNGAYVNMNGNEAFAAASTIKIPILIAFFQDIDQGKIYLDQELVMDEEVMVSGSGNMQYKDAGQKFTAIYTATEMIISSDNTATEMIIRLLGGAEALNKRFQEWGLEVTAIRNPLPDLEGTNTTSPRDLTYLLSQVNNGQLISLKSRDRILDIMQKTKTKTLLPQGLEKEAIIAHKTGDIGTILADAGIIDITTGKRYIGAVLVKRPHNDYSTRTLIQEISRTAYQHFKWYLPHPPLSQKQ